MEMQSNVKVSIVVPIYNAELYLKQCLDSIINQTLKEIEIICVNDGSTDKSAKIVEEYAKKDNRIRVIRKTNTGYGNSMNIGFDAAVGEYVGLIESDDFVDKEMFATLYNVAKSNDLDAVKSSFFFYYSTPKEKNEKYEIVSKVLARKTFCPTTFFKAKMEMVEFFNIKPSIWSAIYKRNFLISNNIRFNETPGASFQDSSFNFKVWTLAERVQLLKEGYVHYRQDNEASSVNSPSKVFCVCDEYEEMEKFLKKHPEKYPVMEYIKNRIKFDSYMWNYERLSKRYKYIFIERMSEEFKEDMKKGFLDRAYFENYKWDTLMEIIEDPVLYHTKRMTGNGTILDKETKDILNSKTYKVVKVMTIFPRKLKGGIKCILDHGVVYTIKLTIKKVKYFQM